MRNWLRKWLGITELERRADVQGDLISALITRTNRTQMQSQAAWDGIKQHLIDHPGLHTVWDNTGEMN